MAEQSILILSGGNALGAYQGGAYETLHEQGFHPDQIFAVSVGAVNAALIAGNPPEKRIDALHHFWNTAVQDGAWAFSPAWTTTWDSKRSRAMQSLLLGSPAVYHTRFPGGLSMLPAMPTDTGLYDLAFLRESLERLVDWDRLNNGEIRLVIVAVDANSGEEIRFDTAKSTINADHLLASCGFIPFFPPTQIDDQLVVDGGMTSNLPLEAALDEAGTEDRLCIALDLFRHGGPDFKTVGQAMDRQLELLLSNQSRRALSNLRQRHELRRQLQLLANQIPEQQRKDPTLASALAEGAHTDRATTLLMLSHAGVPHDTEMRAFDFSRPSLTERWEAGRLDMSHALEALGTRRAAPGEFTVHGFNGSEPRALV
ncbi:patatin-like phospholipase family protein [Vreelandella populi]|uniref:Patatin-like phospholipase family protein n=1 Tax=Vreelandella populi TaxID=2498858 RepID=A0A433LEF4_9GAMM|nr:patatin-like phospholipase family protein [Halomonas populi]RUR35459.1 patatin-like phospholipase family protein [Halomonas populi]RUR47648.1 patatin-like phospholipase family protein [Halomonas populi]RUR54487.1 patatin-like phospholipase family protein [Halomonas populi]